jgi:hypothetical protein
MMARTLVPAGRWSLVSLFILAGAACGGGSSKSPGTSSTTAALHVVSVPVHASQVGNQMAYQAVLSQPGAADWTMDQGPHGASVDEGGNVTWKPAPDQGGDQAFTVSATMNGHTVSQSFTVTAASAVTEASAHVDPSDPNGATVTVDAPLSSVQGTAVQIEPGALPGDQPVAVSISSMQHPPAPAAAQVAGVMPQDLKPVELGPSGLAFKQPVRLQLPISNKLRTMPALAVLTYDYASGRWTKVKTLKIDKTAGVAVAEIEHFSTYVVAPDVPVINLQLALGGSACAGALVVRAPLAVGFSDVPATAVNGYSGTASSLADVLATMKTGEALQVYTRVSARAAAATGEQAGWLLAAAVRQDDGSFKVSVTSDSHAGPFLAVPATGLQATDPELLAWMNGSRADFVFGALGDLGAGAVASAETSFYVVPASDANQAPPASANAFGSEQAEVTMLAPLSGDALDDDCDGAPNKWDPQPAGAAPPVLVGFPPSPAHVAVGAAAPFKISSPQDGVSFTWAASDPSVMVASAMNGAVATATPSIPGLFHVTVTGTRAGATATFVWDLVAEPAAVAANNTPPLVAVSASASIVRAGEPVTLTAFGKDAQQAALTYAWTASDVTTLSATQGQTVVFSAMAPGDYVVGCVASDGSATSAPAGVTITVLSATANRPPGVPSVSPLSAALTHDQGAPVTLTLTAQAVDPDGDALTYDFAPDPATPPTFTLMKSGATATFSSSQDGVYVFYVTATDAKGARGPWAPVKILVLPTLPAQPVDADGDGYPAGFDCNDKDASIHPGAKEICGDGIDQDCDGHDLAKDQCDADGDRYTPAGGDCDDTNPAINPGAIERCDKIDNNCNGQVDEGFGVGVACTNGVGACQATGTTVCSASFVDVVCGAMPGKPQPEVCDGIDNDCNGRVDDVPGNAGSSDAQNCGGCGIACKAQANGVAACVMGGCVSACAAGYVDADRDPANGCECKLTNGGVEICDGLDNDCNGVVDDGAGAVNYPGMPGTLGVGVCAAGVQICVGGQLVQRTMPVLPSPEICDGLDNDCNGKVDDGFDFLNDDKNCGGCGLTCVAGMHCQQGKCPTMTTMGGDGGVVAPDGGTQPPSNLALCQNATGGQGCDDLSSDHANCGACNHACGVMQYCQGGLCMDFPAMNCGTGSTMCLDPSGQKPFCTMIAYDPNNCGGCGKVCAAGMGCMNGVCGGGPAAADGGTAMAPSVDAGATSSQCNAMAPNLCPGPAGSSYCADFNRGASDCGGCGRTCQQGLVCNNGACVTPATGGTCGGNLTMCASGCTSLADDARNCGTCGSFCDGSCNSGMCQAPGQAPFGSTCVRNGDCAGNLCLDQMRFGYPGGFCSSICDANLPCAAGQTCVGSPTSGAFGACRQACAADADCGRAGVFCVAGACQPDCRMSPMACTNGQSCDQTSGRCVTMTAPTCSQPQVTCPTPGGSGTYCTDPNKDPMNCGACWRMCPGGTVCNNGVCGAQTCVAPATACAGPGGGVLCIDLSRDTSNCGACGQACAMNAICTNGQCVGGGGTYPGLAACRGPGGAPFCTNLYNDQGNCGGCGIVCPSGQSCFSGTCGTAQPPPVCPANMQICTDPAGQKQYCSDPRSDPGNCGKCGIVCGAGMGCSNGVCTQNATMADAGTTQTCAPPGVMCGGPMGPYCSSLTNDPSNCGACGRQCPASTYCSNSACVPMPDGGTMPPPTDAGAINCAAGWSACYPATAPPYCADFSNDPGNCGACFKPCPAGWACQAAACVQPTQPTDGGVQTADASKGVSCPAGLYACDNTYCADFMNDPANCGACHLACVASQACQQGQCTLPP